MTNLTINKLNGEWLEMMIGKEVKLNKDIVSKNGRCLKKAGEVGVLVKVLPNFEEATVQFGKRNHKVDYAEISINNIEDQNFILQDKEEKEEREAKALAQIIKINELVTEIHNGFDAEKASKEERLEMSYVSFIPEEWASEYTDSEINEYLPSLIKKYTKINKEMIQQEEETKNESMTLNSDKVINFEEKKLISNVRKIHKDFEKKSDEEIMVGTYKGHLDAYARGKAATYYLGWLKGVEYMMEYIGLDYMKLRREVMNDIKSRGLEIVNGELFEVFENDQV
ncbi:hypothetical protein [Priestia megaterium]|uniref:hypothetical protein n=1 Tax=Priestia megaterium TaxID=1404 RepID=UPI00112D2D9D|nr:hypothetical protein [Priestia megaterium]TPF17978.1 hypothetical protein CBE78_01770 [Priestia megaterium]TPF22086.1 hypothetical protein CBE79_04275 [Priestia megaterium]